MTPVTTLAMASSRLTGVVRFNRVSGQRGVLSFFSMLQPPGGFGNEAGISSQQFTFMLLPLHPFFARQYPRRFMEPDPLFFLFVSVARFVHDIDDVVKNQRGPQIEIVEQRHDTQDPEELA